MYLRDIRANSAGGCARAHCVPIHECMGKWLADRRRQAGPYLSLSPRCTSGQLTGVGFFRPEA